MVHLSIPASDMGLCQTLVPAAPAEPPLPPSRSCPRGPTCRASAAPTAGATGAASKPGEGCPSTEAATEGSSRGCEGGCTGEQLAGGSLCIWVKISEWGVPRMGITVPRPGCAQCFGFAPPTLARMGGWRRSILLETCARNVSCLSCAVSITPMSLGSAGAWWLVRLGHGHLGGTGGSRDGEGQT